MMTGLNRSGVEIGLDVDWGILLRDLFRIVCSMVEVCGVKGSQNTKKLKKWRNNRLEGIPRHWHLKPFWGGLCIQLSTLLL